MESLKRKEERKTEERKKRRKKGRREGRKVKLRSSREVPQGLGERGGERQDRLWTRGG